MVVQQKTGWPVQFEITADARASLLAWLERRMALAKLELKQKWRSRPAEGYVKAQAPLMEQAWQERGCPLTLTVAAAVRLPS
jgi:hypothetical protein